MKDSRQDTLCSRSYKNISSKQLQDKFLSIANEYYNLLGIVSQCDHCLSLFKQKIGDHNHQEGGPSTDSTRLTEEAIKNDSYNKII